MNMDVPSTLGVFFMMMYFTPSYQGTGENSIVSLTAAKASTPLRKAKLTQSNPLVYCSVSEDTKKNTNTT